MDLNPISRITIDAVGQPGNRIFLLQASQGLDMVTIKIEKEQAKALAASINELLEDLDKQQPRSFSKLDRPLSSEMMLQEPMEPAFIAGQIGLGYDQEQDMVVLVIQELLFEDENREPQVARFWASRPQMESLSEHTLQVAERGRPVCPLCNAPINPEGHFCPRSNGHEKPRWV